MEEKKHKHKMDRIGMILYTMYILLLLASLLVIAKIVYMQYFEPADSGLSQILTPKTTKDVLEPIRGNILDCNGRLLAISCPTYQIYMDCTVRKEEFAKMKDTHKADSLEALWLAKSDTLAEQLSTVFPEKTKAQFRAQIRNGRNNGRKYEPIGHRVSLDTLKLIRSFHLFKEGANKGGIIVKTHQVRKHPYGKLAGRTIGFVRDTSVKVSNTHVGIEGKYDYELHGKDGVEFTRHTDAGPVRNNDSTYRKAVDGNDVRTTLDIDYQAIADQALRNGISGENDVEGGCLVLMEVKTGAIRAMVNLLRDGDRLEESYNMAIGRRGEPGSVFKTVTLMSVLSDGHIRSLSETLPTNHGIVEGAKIRQDDHIVSYERNRHSSRISVLDGFKMSSNYVFATLALKYYGQDFKKGNGLQKFLGNIYSYKLGDPIDFDLDGMLKPIIPSPESRYLTPTDLGCIAYGYSTNETPLQILTFYNAIAGKGRMMKPYLIEDIEKKGEIISMRGPAVLSASICTEAVADTLTRALKTVTEEGTATRLKSALCQVAGKTGTAKILLDNGKYEDSRGWKKNQGTFVGFFPADDPQYSIICTIYSKLSDKSFYGGTIPAEAVKEVVDKVYTTDPRFKKSM